MTDRKKPLKEEVGSNVTVVCAPATTPYEEAQLRGVIAEAGIQISPSERNSVMFCQIVQGQDIFAPKSPAPAQESPKSAPPPVKLDL